MATDNKPADAQSELEVQFGKPVRIFEFGFFAVALAGSLALLIAMGGTAPLGGSLGFRSLLAMLLGASGSFVSFVGGLNAWKLLRDPRPALEASERGILNRTYWSATTIVPGTRSSISAGPVTPGSSTSSSDILRPTEVGRSYRFES